MYEFEYRPLYFILTTELIFVICLMSFVFIKRIFHIFSHKKGEKRIDALKADLVSRLTKPNEKIDVRVKRGRERELIFVLEGFDKRFREPGWDELKKSLIESYVLKKARRWVYYPSWKKKSLAARSFALLPLQEDEEAILKLLNHRQFLIFSNAVKAALGIECEKALPSILDRMGKEMGYSFFYCRECLRFSSPKMLGALQELAKNSKYHGIVLNILSTLTLGKPFPGLIEDIQSENLKIRSDAIVMLSHNPGQGCIQKLIEMTTDQHMQIQAKATAALGNFKNEETVNRLKELLCAQETHWKVRLEAAMALKKLGVLETFDCPQEGQAKEFADYAMQFGEEWIQKRL